MLNRHTCIGETESDGKDLGDSEGGSSGSDGDEFVGNTLVDLDAMEEDRLTDIGGGGDDYNLDGGRVTSRAPVLLS
ncbi:hypothetical protein PIB30_069923 [Stylosanthes scabra]|uniref:Uncharacterized protein n=1 Tax=Stylosanthes scabra TaxID=79078 RepID=A0ABU6SNG0_9FABA|nr:hypothetical protein [Stylosanthes scabra]